jgi:hypothetical protein
MMNPDCRSGEGESALWRLPPNARILHAQKAFCLSKNPSENHAKNFW